MDLIEILWKQDVDMGFSVGEWSESNNEPLEAEEVEESSIVKIKEPILKEKEKVSIFITKLFIFSFMAIACFLLSLTLVSGKKCLEFPAAISGSGDFRNDGNLVL